MISSELRKVGPFIGNGVATAFPFTFKVFDPTDLLVVRADTSSGLETTLVLNSDYTVTLNADQDNNPGGTVTLGLPLATGLTLIVSSDIEQLQETELTNLGGFFPEVITAALDKLTILVQQMQEEVSRCIKIAITDPVGDAELPIASARKGMFLGFDVNDGSPEVVVGTSIIPQGGTNTVAYSATPTFDLSLGTQQGITLTGNVTSSTLTIPNGSSAIFIMRIKQDATGGRTFAWPGNIDNAGAVSTDPNSTSVQMFAVGTNGRATALGPIMYS